MQHWFSIHFYLLETSDVFLTRAVKPFLAQSIWNEKNTRAFFIRYEDERGPHIRLRMRGEAAWIAETLRPAWTGWMEGRGEWQEVDYQPEIKRFGGAEGLALAEEHFHISTRVVLERIERAAYTYGDALYDALRMHVITAHAAGLDWMEAAAYFGRLCDAWIPVFFQPIGEQVSPKTVEKELKSEFEARLLPQFKDLQDACIALWKALEADKIDKNQPEWLRWLRGNQLIMKELGNNLEYVLPHLLHLNSNRLGVNNQDEVYVNYILSRVLGQS
jgi:thiopeptide-type bacteriocin biosynthesis protein